MKQLKVSLSDDDIAALADLSRETGLSLSSLIRLAVRNYLNSRKNKPNVSFAAQR